MKFIKSIAKNCIDVIKKYKTNYNINYLKNILNFWEKELNKKMRQHA